MPSSTAQRSTGAKAGAKVGNRADADPRYARNYEILAERLKTTRKTLHSWRKKYGEAAPRKRSDGKHVIADWESFMAEHGLSGGNGQEISPRGGDDPDLDEDGNEIPLEKLSIEALKRRDLRVKIEERTLKVDVARGNYLLTDDVREAWTKNVARCVSMLRGKLENELPPILSGQDAIGIREEMQRVVDEFSTMMSEGDAQEQIDQQEQIAERERDGQGEVQ